MTAQLPLPFLLRSVLSALEREYTELGAGKGEMPPLDLWSNLLRAVPAAGVDRGALPQLLRLSKRAVRTRLGTAVRHGWVEDSGLVRLTPRGAASASRWKILQAAAEQRWQSAAGVQAGARLRVALEALVSALPLEHPHYPASYGPADASITGGNGADWKPVPRDQSESVAELPLSALLSQALVAFAMDYEERSPVALSLSMDVIALIPPEGRQVREIGRSPGVSALVRHGFMQLNGAGAAATAMLTPRGAAVAREFHPRLSSVERGWCERFGAETIASLRSALEYVVWGHGIRRAP